MLFNNVTKGVFIDVRIDTVTVFGKLTKKNSKKNVRKLNKIKCAKSINLFVSC